MVNDKIYELAKQAGMIEFESIPGSATVTPDYESVVKARRFAELIVGECCDVLQNEDIRHSGYGYNQGFLHKKIKAHFGVEE